MSRTINSSLLTALTSAEVEPYFAVEFVLDGTPIRLWTGHGDKTINSQTYTGSGDLLSISGLEEVNDISAKTVAISLSGMPSEIVAMALDEDYQRRVCRIYFGTRDTTTPIEIFTGYLNKMTIDDSGDSSTITVNVDSKLIRLERASNWRYTDASHQARESGDVFLSYVAALQDVRVSFGQNLEPIVVDAAITSISRLNMPRF